MREIGVHLHANTVSVPKGLGEARAIRGTESRLTRPTKDPYRVTTPLGVSIDDVRRAVGTGIVDHENARVHDRTNAVEQPFDVPGLVVGGDHHDNPTTVRIHGCEPTMSAW